MSATWDSQAEKTDPIAADEILIIDTEDSRNQKRATLSSIGGATWTRNSGSGFIFPTTLTDFVGIGTVTPLAILNSLSTLEQLRLSYDATNYASFTVDSGGDLTITPSNVRININAIMDLVDGSAYQIGSVTVLSSTTLGSAVLSSSLTSFGTSPTIVTPTIASFTNATHDHSNAAGGGQLLSTSALSDTTNIAYLNTANTYSSGITQDFGTSDIINVGSLGVGVSTTSAFLHVLGITEQLRLSYDATNYTSFTVGSSGNLTITPTGGDLTIADTLNVQGQVINFGESANNIAQFFNFRNTGGTTTFLQSSGGSAGNFSISTPSNKTLTLQIGSTSAIVIDGSADVSISNDLSVTGDLTVDTNTLFVDSTTGFVGTGTILPLAQFNSLSTLEQLRLSYDATNYASFTVDSTGDLTIAPTGANLSLTASLDISNGTELLPSYSFTSDLSTGMRYDSSTPSLAFSVNGLDALKLETTALATHFITVSSSVIDEENVAELFVDGDDANIPLDIFAKGSAGLSLGTTSIHGIVSIGQNSILRVSDTGVVTIGSNQTSTAVLTDGRVLTLRSASGALTKTRLSIFESDTLDELSIGIGQAIEDSGAAFFNNLDGTEVRIGTSAGTAISISSLNVTIPGNLIVDGTTTTKNTEIINVNDNHLYLNAGYTTPVATDGGLVVNYLPTSTTDTVSDGIVTAASLVSGGTGYNNTTETVNIIGTGTGATATVTVSGGIITSIDSIDTGGTGYVDGEAVTLTGQTSGATDATATITAPGIFTAGVASTSNPTVTTSGAATFSTSDLIQVSSSNDDENDGIYEVLSHAANLLTIRGVGITSTVKGFSNNQFTSNASDTAAITKVTVSILHAGTDGIWEEGKGSDSSFTFSDHVTVDATQTLLNKTLTTPTIASFINATHDHVDAAGGGQLLSTTTLSDTANIVYNNQANTYSGGGLQDFGTSAVTIGGDFTVATDAFFVDSTTNEVIIGSQTSTGAFLDITGTGTTTSLITRAGNSFGIETGRQIEFGHGGTALFRHAIITQHNSGASNGNLIFFNIWDQSVDSTTTVGTYRGLSIGTTGIAVGKDEATVALDIVGQAHILSTDADTTAIVTTESTGTNAGTTSKFVGSQDPDGNVTGAGGDEYYRDNGVLSNIFFNKEATTGTNWETVSLDPSVVHQIFSTAEYEDLGTSSIITTGATQNVLKLKSSVTSSTRHVLSSESSGLQFIDEVGNNAINYIGSSAFITSAAGGNVTTRNANLTSAIPGKQLFDYLGDGGFPAIHVVSILDSSIIVLWDLGTIGRLPTAEEGPIVTFNGASALLGSQAGLTVDSSRIFAMDSLLIDQLDAAGFGGALVTIKDSSYKTGRATFFTLTGNLYDGSSLVRIDAGLPNDYRVNVFNTNIVLNGTATIFDTSGSTGSFTAVANNSITSTSITSVVDSSGVASFTHAGTSPDLGSLVTVSGFTTNTDYNTTGIVTATTATTFEIDYVAFGTTETGSYAVTAITITATAHGLTQGTGVTLDTTLSTDYDGGFLIYNIQTNSFDVPATFVATEAGTWSTEGLDQSDPRVLATNNPGTADSKTIAEGVTNANVFATTITDGTYAAIDVSTHSVINNELFKLIDTTNAIWEYLGNEDFNGKLTGNLSGIKTGSTGEYRIAMSTNGVVPTFATANYVPMEVKTSTIGTPLEFSVVLTKGDTIQIMMAGDGTSDNITVTDLKTGIQ